MWDMKPGLAWEWEARLKQESFEARLENLHQNCPMATRKNKGGTREGTVSTTAIMCGGLQPSCARP